jgi:hypothetical protein
MWTPRRSALLRYSIVPFVVAQVLLTRCLLLDGEMPFLLLWPAAMVSEWFGGFGPGSSQLGSRPSLPLACFLNLRTGFPRRIRKTGREGPICVSGVGPLPAQRDAAPGQAEG